MIDQIKAHLRKHPQVPKVLACVYFSKNYEHDLEEDVYRIQYALERETLGLDAWFLHAHQQVKRPDEILEG